MASGLITSWHIDGETAADFIFLGSKLTADGDCSHEIKRCLLLGRKVMTNLVIAKSLQSCLTLCNPIDCSPPGSAVPGILQARTLEWVAISFPNLESILKSGDITLPTKVRLVKAMVFPVVIYGIFSWRRKWQPTLVFLPGESQGPGSLVGCRLWGRTESDTTEVT